MLQGLVGPRQNASDLAKQALHTCHVAVSLQAKALWALLWAFEQLIRAEEPRAVLARAPAGKAHADAAARFTSAAQRSGQLRPALAAANTNAGEPCQHLDVLPLEGACKCESLLSTSILVWGAPHDSCPAPCPTTLYSATHACDVDRPLLLLAGMVRGVRGDLDATDTITGQQDWQIPAVHGEGAENSQGPMTHTDAAGGQYQVIPASVQLRSSLQGHSNQYQRILISKVAACKSCP